MVAEEYLRDGASALLAEIPAFENHGDIVGQVINRKRPTIKQKHNDWFAGAEHRPNEVLLAPEQIETRAVAQVLLRPTFARCLLVATQREHNDLGSLSDPHRFG